MKKGLIITLPRHDDVTEYLSQFSKEIIEEANISDVPCKKLEDYDANRKNFEKVLEKTNYKLIVFNGHGTENSIGGYDDEPIIEEKVNEKILAERIVYARACDAACSLGMNSVKESNEGCFIGYELPFQFYCDKTWATNPLKDQVAPLFLNPSNVVAISILKGKIAREANDSSRKAILKNMRRVLRKSNADSLAIAEALWNNYEGQVLLGNENATL